MYPQTPPARGVDTRAAVAGDDMLQALLCNLPDPYWIFRFDAGLVFLNRAVCGYGREEWQADSFNLIKRVLSEKSWDALTQVWSALRAHGEPCYDLELKARASDADRERTFRVNLIPVKDADGLVIGLHGNARDITELAEAHAAVVQAETKRKVPLENLPRHILWAYYFDGRAPYANRGCCGYSAEEWAGGGLEFLLAAHNPSCRKRLRSALDYIRAAGERVLNLEVEITPKNGGIAHHFLVNLVPIYNGGDTVVGIEGIHHDVTELVTTRQELKEARARYLEIIETAHDLIWSIDLSGRWSYLNQATLHVYGCDPKDMLGKPFTEAVHPEHRTKDWEMMQEILKGRDITQHETIHLRKDGSTRNLSFNIKPQMDDKWNIVGAMGTARDITEQSSHQEQLRYLAEHDTLTGLHNRYYFQRELERTVAQHRRPPPALFYIDLDNFKYVNDVVGHAAGDQMLLEVTRVLQQRLRSGDVLARFGGDEFTVLLHDVSQDNILQVAEYIRRMLASYVFVREDKAFNVYASIGITLIREVTISAHEVLAQADIACTIAKSRGRNQVHLYDSADVAKANMLADVGWSQRIRQALNHEYFAMVFQPIVDLATGQVSDYEALLRLREPGADEILPSVFLPAAERFGLIHDIDRWVVSHTIAHLGRVRRAGEPLRFNINLSGRAFEDKELPALIRHSLVVHNVDPASVIFEITESVAIARMGEARAFIEQMRKLGCRFALDDFGVGFSSFSYLKTLPVDYLKIDGGFVQHMADDPVDQAIVNSLNQVAHALGKKTVAEFVEDARTLELLKQYGVDYAQGYYLGRPADGLSPDNRARDHWTK